MNATRHAPRSACPACSAGALVREVRVSRFEYRGETLTYDQSGDWCTECGEAVLSGEDLEATEGLLIDFMQRVDRAQAEELSRIRRKLKLTQKQAAALTGGGHNAFSRYERGEAKPLPAVIHLFRLLDRHPELLNELRVNKAGKRGHDAQ
jgi:HTH-type transcriptional regulator/antitoxin MqsA